MFDHAIFVCPLTRLKVKYFFLNVRCDSCNIIGKLVIGKFKMQNIERDARKEQSWSNDLNKRCRKSTHHMHDLTILLFNPIYAIEYILKTTIYYSHNMKKYVTKYFNIFVQYTCIF